MHKPAMVRIKAIISGLIILWALLLVCPGRANQKQKEDHLLRWSSGYKLRWEDFQGNPNTDSPEDLVCATRTMLGLNFACKGKAFSSVVHCYFDRSRSWRRGFPEDKLLKHEQLHFDLSELFTRKLRQELRNITVVDSNIEAVVNGIEQRMNKACIAQQQLYDTETNHARNQAEQKRWEELIGNELRGLEHYSSDH